MSCPLSVAVAAGAVGTNPMAWMVCCTGACACAGAGAAAGAAAGVGAGAGAGAGVTSAAETDRKGAFSLSSFLKSYSPVFCASVSFPYPQE
jgi:hypothetical protein